MIWLWVALMVEWICTAGLALLVLQLYKERALARLQREFRLTDEQMEELSERVRRFEEEEEE